MPKRLKILDDLNQLVVTTSGAHGITTSNSPQHLVSLIAPNPWNQGAPWVAILDLLRAQVENPELLGRWPR